MVNQIKRKSTSDGLNEIQKEKIKYHKRMVDFKTNSYNKKTLQKKTYTQYFFF